MRMKLFALLLLAPLAANASFINNGTFDTDLSGWDQSGSLPTMWVAETAHIGRPGTPGTSVLSQVFTIPDVSAVEISFDYEWQIDAPTLTDFFSVDFAAAGAVFTTILTSDSDNAVFGTTVNFSTVIDLTGLDLISSNASIAFNLIENNQTRGTRVQLDNVVVRAASVPEPTSLALLGLGLAGFGWARRRRA